MLAAFTTQRIDPVFFVGSAIIIVFFWMADAQSYFYQRKLRLRMNALQEEILRRGTSHLIFDGVGMPIPVTRQNLATSQSVIYAIFNWSMTFYYGLLAIDVLALSVYRLGGLHSKP